MGLETFKCMAPSGMASKEQAKAQLQTSATHVGDIPCFAPSLISEPLGCSLKLRAAGPSLQSAQHATGSVSVQLAPRGGHERVFNAHEAFLHTRHVGVEAKHSRGTTLWWLWPFPTFSFLLPPNYKCHVLSVNCTQCYTLCAEGLTKYSLNERREGKLLTSIVIPTSIKVFVSLCLTCHSKLPKWIK